MDRKIKKLTRAICAMLALQWILSGPLPAAAGNELEPYRVASAHQFNIRSRSGLDYRIFLYRPEAPSPPGGYPVIYVLDGNAWFDPVAHAVRMQARHAPMSGVMPAVVVGIGYPSDGPFDQPRRFLDFVPAIAAEADMPPQHRAYPTGGASSFRSFIVDELQPAIEELVRIDPGRRILYGHSLGCSFVLHLLFTDPEAFPNYVCSSPSLGFGGSYLLDEEASFRASIGSNAMDVRLLLAAGEFEEKVPPGVPAAYRDSYEAAVRRAKVVTGLTGLHDRLSPLADKGLRTDLLVIGGENHLSVVPVVANRMLELLLRPTSADLQAFARKAAQGEP